MAKGVRFTKAEEQFLRTAVTASQGLDARLAASIVAKLDASHAPAGVAIGPIEAAMERAARGKLVRLESGHAIASRRALDLQVTEADAEMVGRWMARQGWLTGPMTILDVFHKWHQWLPKARTTEPPPELSPGLGDDDTRRGTQEERPAPTRGRTTPGFR